MAVHVTSEIGRLKSVLVHPPGAELYAVTPSTRVDYLYDDIMDVPAAQREHRRFVAILERFAEVHYVHDLLTEVLSDAEVKQLLIRDTLDILRSEERRVGKECRPRRSAYHLQQKLGGS